MNSHKNSFRAYPRSEQEGFYMVFKDDNTMRSTMKHQTRQLAIDEASRLAIANPGQKFYVACFTGAAQVMAQPTPFKNLTKPSAPVAPAFPDTVGYGADSRWFR